MKIVITNQVALNGGDAAILEATVRMLKENLANPEIVILDTHPELARKYHPAHDFKPTLYIKILETCQTRLARYVVALSICLAAFASRFLKKEGILKWFPDSLMPSLALYWQADFVLSCGGTYFVPNYQTLPKIFDLVLATLLNRPIVLFTQSLGPFSGKHQWLLHYVLRRADLILLRDERSQKHLQDFGISLENVRIVQDAAFALADPTDFKRVPKNPPKIAISMRAWPYFKNKENREGMDKYVASVETLCRHLVTAHDAEITFLSTCQGIAEYAYDDAAVARQVASRLQNDAHFESVQVDTDFHAPEDLIAQYGKFDIVVATRMHAAILALCAGTPVLPISYEFKTDELFDELGMGQYVVQLEDIDGQSLVETFENFFANLDKIRLCLPDTIALARDSALQAGPLLRTVLDRRETR